MCVIIKKKIKIYKIHKKSNGYKNNIKNNDLQPLHETRLQIILQ